MQTQIRWNTKELTKDLPEDESGFYKAIGELLPEIEIPNKLYISCHMGDAEFLLKQRGTYTKNGEVRLMMQSVSVTGKNCLPRSSGNILQIPPSCS